MKNIALHAKWTIKAPRDRVFAILTDFERWPEYFPKVAESIHIKKLKGNDLEIDATVKSFGREFPVHMRTRILPGKGFISENVSPQFGTSGHEEVLLFESIEGTIIDYSYLVVIQKPWLRIVAKPLIGWFSMKYWETAVIGELRKRLEKK